MSSPDLTQLKTQITDAHDRTNRLFKEWHRSELGHVITQIEGLLLEYTSESTREMPREAALRIADEIKKVRKTAVETFLARHPETTYEKIVDKPKNPYTPKVIKRPFFWLRRTKGVAYSVQAFHSKANRCSPLHPDGRPVRSPEEDAWLHAEIEYVKLKKEAASAYPRAPRAPEKPKWTPEDYAPGGPAPADYPRMPGGPGHPRMPGKPRRAPKRAEYVPGGPAPAPENAQSRKYPRYPPVSRGIPPFPAYR